MTPKKTRKRGGVWNPIIALKRKRLMNEMIKALDVPPNREKITAILQNPDFDVNRIYSSKHYEGTPLMYVIFNLHIYRHHRQIYLDIIDEFLTHPTIDVSYPDPYKEDNALSDAIYYKDLEVMQKLISKLKSNQDNIIYIHAILLYIKTEQEEINALPAIHALLQKGVNPHLKLKNGYKSPIDTAKENGYDYIVTLLETGTIPTIHENTSFKKPWTGFSRSDIDFTNNIFHESIHPENLAYSNPEESLFSICPICLKHIQHASGSCMYMTHSCVEQAGYEGYYHKKLWKAFSYPKNYNDHGELLPIEQRRRVVEWCTHCGRICKGHRHYKLSNLYNESGSIAIPAFAGAGDYFAVTCAKPEIGGGGTKEKILRYRKFREMVHDLNKPELIGKISYEDAINRLVEAVWEAPLTPKNTELEYIERERKYNAPVADETFPLSSELPATPKYIYSDLTYPDTNNPDLLPIVYPKATETMKNAMEHLSGDEENIVQFRHRMSDGTVNNHNSVNQQIALDRLMDYLSDLSTQQDSEHYGLCWQHEPLNYTEVYDPEHKPSQCTARLYPEEVLHAIQNATYSNELHKANHMQKYNAYRVGFANKFGVPIGIAPSNTVSGGYTGKRTRKQKRKTRRFY